MELLQRNVCLERYGYLLRKHPQGGDYLLGMNEGDHGVPQLEIVKGDVLVGELRIGKRDPYLTLYHTLWDGISTETDTPAVSRLDELHIVYPVARVVAIIIAHF